MTHAEEKKQDRVDMEADVVTRDNPTVLTRKKKRKAEKANIEEPGAPKKETTERNYRALLSFKKKKPR